MAPPFDQQTFGFATVSCFFFFFARRVVGSVNKPYKPDSISESAGRAQILTVYVVDVE